MVRCCRLKHPSQLLDLNYNFISVIVKEEVDYKEFQRLGLALSNGPSRGGAS
jgi:hypothetical protein